MTGNPILDSALILGGVGLFFGFLIALANKKFYVWEDPRIGEVEELLPNSNCGACGQPGCRAFAEAVVGGKEQPSGCTVMGEEDLADVASYLMPERLTSVWHACFAPVEKTRLPATQTMRGSKHVKLQQP
jgi:Na+-translocating ferredoxin:NAD+ oxidoreductase RNF subunit RnfB